MPPRAGNHRGAHHAPEHDCRRGHRRGDHHRRPVRRVRARTPRAETEIPYRRGAATADDHTPARCETLPRPRPLPLLLLHGYPLRGYVPPDGRGSGGSRGRRGVDQDRPQEDAYPLRAAAAGRAAPHPRQVPGHGPGGQAPADVRQQRGEPGPETDRRPLRHRTEVSLPLRAPHLRHRDHPLAGRTPGNRQQDAGAQPHLHDADLRQSDR